MKGRENRGKKKSEVPSTLSTREILQNFTIRSTGFTLCDTRCGFPGFAHERTFGSPSSTLVYSAGGAFRSSTFRLNAAAPSAWSCFTPRRYRQAVGQLKEMKTRWYGLFHFLAANPDVFRIAPKSDHSADSAEYEVTLLNED